MQLTRNYYRANRFDGATTMVVAIDAQVLCALIELVDPHLLVQPGDPLDIRPLIDQLPPEFGIEAQHLLDRRRKEVDRRVESNAIN